MPPHIRRASLLVGGFGVTLLALIVFAPSMASLLFFGVPWIAGWTAIVAWAYDWCLRAGEDLEAAREEDNRAHARETIPAGGSLNQNVH